MDADSEGDDHVVNGKEAAAGGGGGDKSGGVKPKRQMKTPFQLQTLEKAFTTETYPSEALRAELSEKLGLSDRQLQMWFCHRRLKEKKETPVKKQRKPLPESPKAETRLVGTEHGSDYGSGSGSGSGSSPFTEPRKVSLDVLPMMRRYYESSPQSLMERRAIACVEAQLTESLREDGPILGMEFDPLPPGAFGMPIEPTASQHKRSRYSYENEVFDHHEVKPSKASTRALHEYQFLQDRSSSRSDTHGQVAQSPFHDSPAGSLKGRASSYVHGDDPVPRVPGIHGQLPPFRPLPQIDKGHTISSPHADDDYVLQRDSFSNPAMGTKSPELFDAQIFDNDASMHMDRKRKTDESRTARDVEGHESRMRKELEKQDMLRRKSEERMKKEIERHDRERRKEEERLMRERQREEERILREQRRELERKEKFMQKEYLRAEKRKQKEELRREREEEKRKAAMEKATARKFAKESLDLIEDEQLELMELAAASKNIPSIAQLDFDSLQSLEIFRDSLCKFPPLAVQLKKPFLIQPWADSEEHVGNLLMVWRFFIAFSDVLGLWPFTLEEFVQALHDYDSRLLGEVHVSLLKLIIKDIEDVARTPSTGLGTNQYSVANSEGGHPQIVEGAYMWGFDIRNWQRNINPLTWPEIFRQLALSAGFGPRLSKRNAAQTYGGHNDELKDCEDAISTLRDGSAAENAFALMREKGLFLPRKSRHRLTPGTVKFAAFHVLSLEGSKGLTVLELAEKIQKSGLRDLTTSKTPEASISVAMTRDQKLFERIAPSTYCVRAPYRKDPADADAILATAIKKIRNFENGFLDGEIPDEVDRDDESDGEVDEDPEVDDLSTPLSAQKSVDDSNLPNERSEVTEVNISSDAPLVPQNELEKVPLPIFPSGPKQPESPNAVEQVVALDVVGTNNIDQESIEVDETKPCESWVQGLAEGDYCHLSVEERLSGLVALVGLANEGNCIRSVLEDRLEAANALKKQMWAEAQFDRSRFKDDIIRNLDFPYFTVRKYENKVGSSVMDGSQSPMLLFDGKNKEASPSAAGAAQNDLNSFPIEKTLVVQDPSTNLDSFSTQQHYTSKRSRSQLKAYIGHIAEEMYVYRSLPLGQDRQRNRYWQFVASTSSNDPCCGRIFVELHDGSWRVIDSEEAFDTFFSSLDVRGVRESHLRVMLLKIEKSFKENVRRTPAAGNNACQSGILVKDKVTEADSSPNSSPGTASPSSTVCGSNSDTGDRSSLFRIDLARSEKEKMRALKRYKEFQQWMWKELLDSLTVKDGVRRSSQLLATCESCFDSYIPEGTQSHSCHQNISTNNSSKFMDPGMQYGEERRINGSINTVPLGIKLLKALLACFEVCVPAEVIEPFWTESYRETWGMKLNGSSSVEELFQLLTVFESAIRRERLYANFETTQELLGSSSSHWSSVSDPANLGSVSVLPWVPKTIAAVGLRLFELYSSVIYEDNEKAEHGQKKPFKVHMKLHPGYSPFVSKEREFKTTMQGEFVKENVFEQSSRRGSNKRRGGSRSQGNNSRLQKRVPKFKPDKNRKTAKLIDNLSRGLRQQRARTNVQKSARGRRTVRKRRTEKMVANEILLGRMSEAIGPNNYSGSQKNFNEEWGVQKDMMDMEAADNSNSIEAAESDENAGQEAYEQANWGQGLNGGNNGWNVNMAEASDDDGDMYGNINGVEDVREDDSDGGAEMSDDGVANQMENGDGVETEESDDYSD